MVTGVFVKSEGGREERGRQGGRVEKYKCEDERREEIQRNMKK